MASNLAKPFNKKLNYFGSEVFVVLSRRHNYAVKARI